MEEALPRLLARVVARLPGMGVFMSSTTTHAPPVLVHMIERERALEHRTEEGVVHEHRGTQIYVSNGTGYWGPPMRLGAPAEITHLELAKG